jgi:hypothetical protein
MAGRTIRSRLRSITWAVSRASLRRLAGRSFHRWPHRGRAIYILYDGLWYSATVPSYQEQVVADEFEEHQARAGRPIISAREAQQVWDNGFLPRRNVRGAQDTRLLIGRTDGGRQVTLVSRHLGEGIWMTYTAWDTKGADLA